MAYNAVRKPGGLIMGRHRQTDREGSRALRRRADRIARLIVATDYPAIDVVIEIRKHREFAQEHFPDRMRLFEMVYEGRFRRLWAQFRPGDEALPDW